MYYGITKHKSIIIVYNNLSKPITEELHSSKDKEMERFLNKKEMLAILIGIPNCKKCINDKLYSVAMCNYYTSIIKNSKYNMPYTFFCFHLQNEDSNDLSL